MSTFSALHTSDYTGSNGPRIGLRRSFERQLSDKHLKRRTQITMQNSHNNNGSSNKRFLYEDPLATISSSSQHEYEWHRCCPDKSGFKFRRKRSVFLVLALLTLIVLFAASLWYSTLGITEDSENLDGGGGEPMRSYQDLADSIKSLRKRRNARKAGEQSVDDDRDSFDNKMDDNGDSEEERLKRIEQQIQRDQNEKVRHEIEKDSNVGDSGPVTEADKAALKDKAMAENIAALKQLNQKLHKID